MIVAFGGPLSRTERLALAGALVIAGALMWPVRHGLTDTAFVWLHYADHLAHGSGLVFNLGERVYAAVNPLWLGLLADAISLGMDGLTFARVIGALSTLVSVALFMQLMRRTVRAPIVRAVATVAWACQAWMAQYSVSGMETSFGVALTLAGFVALTEGPEWGDRPVRTSALWALAALARPGAALMLVMYGTALLVDAQNRPGLRRLVFGVTPALAIYGSWMLFTRLYYGTVWPQVMSLPPDSNPSAALWWGRFWAQATTIAGTEGVLAGAGILAFLLTRRPPGPRPTTPALRLLPIAFVILLPALFAARGLSVSPRHLLLVIPVIHWLAWRAVDSWCHRDGDSSTASMRTVIVSVVLGVLVIGQNVVVYRTRVLPEVRARSAGLENSLVRWGKWLRVNAPPGTTVASFAPGALARYGQVRVLDLSGLMSPSMLEARQGLADREVVSRLAFEPVARAEYAVDRDVPSKEMLARSPFRRAFELIDERDQYAFYRIHWDRVTAATPPR